MSTLSPFRAEKAATRIRAAHSMIATRQAEIRALEKALDKAATHKERRVLTQRLQATTHNLASWRRYTEDGSPREPRAVIVPTR